MNGIKIAVIGGGSSYTPELIEGIIQNHASLPVRELVLVDIEEGRKKLTVIESLARRMFKKAGLDVRLSATLDRRQALSGADFVLSQIRAGGLEARRKDESIPLEFGLIGQETTGAGGFAKALRTIPVVLGICRDMEEICPGAWLINFTNPSGIITTAVTRHSHIKCVGLCNIPINMERAVTGLLGVDPSRVNCRFMGLNHLSFIRNVYLDGEDITSEILDQIADDESIVKNIPDIAWSIDLIRALGVIPSPYLKYFYQTRAMLAEEKEAMNKGRLRACEVMAIEKELFALYRDPDLREKPAQLSQRGGAYYSEIAISLIHSIYNNTSRVHVVNTVNRGAIPDLPYDSIVETNSLVNASGAHPLAAGPLPLTVRGLVQEVKAYEELTVAAAVAGSKETALAALVNNPLVRDASVARDLLDRIIEAHPGYIHLK